MAASGGDAVANVGAVGEATDGIPVANAAELAAFLRRWQAELVERSTEEEARAEKERVARELYARGAVCEYDGNYMDAIRYYKQAFKMHPDLEREVGSVKIDDVSVQSEATLGNLSATIVAPPTTITPKNPDGQERPSLLNVLTTSWEALPLLERDNTEASGVHLSDIPVEIQLHILSKADPVSVERFGRTCKCAFLLSRDGMVWKDRCLSILSKDMLTARISEYRHNWRALYIDLPRVHCDGLYICKHSYYRPGEADFTQTYAPVMQITYWRYLRFFDDGALLVMTSPVHPKQALPSLAKEAKRNPHTYEGQWALKDGVVRAWARAPSCTYYYVLTCQSSRSSRSNKLTLIDYTAVDHRPPNRITDFSGIDEQVYRFFSFAQLDRLREEQAQSIAGRGKYQAT